VVGIAWALLAFPQVQFGMGQGYAVGFPIATGVLLWTTVEKITHRRPYARIGLVWAALPLILAVPALLAGLGTIAFQAPAPARAVCLGIAVALVAVSFGVRRLCALLGRLRDERILRGQARAAGRLTGAGA